MELPRRCAAAAIVAVVLAVVAAHAPAASSLGEAPVLGTGARDLQRSYRLPPLQDAPASELGREVRTLQMGQRAQALRLDLRSAQDAWSAADAALAAAERRLAATKPVRARSFRGSRASLLNALLRDRSVASIRVLSERIEIDEPIVVRRAGTWLDLGDARLEARSRTPTFLLRIEGTSDVTVSGGAFVGGRWAVLVADARDVTLRDGRYADLRNGGITVTNAANALVAGATLTRIGGAPILVHGESVGAALLHNRIVANTGSSNWHAGVVISDRRADLARTPRELFNDDGYGVVAQPITTRLQPPRRTLLAYNRIASNASSGVYVDGAVGSVLFQNVVEGNSKEGICLDNGSAANVLAMNLVRGNGKRWGKSDAELRLDFVAHYGRLADGSSPAKTPGISLDNALYNVVYANHLDRNHGGGVKMVRTSFFNVVGMNVLTDNNEGANERFHFFGIELGAARPDVPVDDLDFAPSRGNIVFGNVIRGGHYAGIFFDEGSSRNDVFDNAIFGATVWALEQVRPQDNASLNNLTNLPSRNIVNGLDQRLVDPGKRAKD